MADIGELVVRIKADAAQLEREMKRAGVVVEDSTKKWGSALGLLRSQFAGLIPTLSAAVLVGFSKKAIDAAGALQDMAERTDTTVSFLSAMERQAGETGASLADIGTVLGMMSNSIGEAAKNAEGPLAQAFRDLNIDLEQLKSLRPEEQFYLISQRISELGTQFERTEAARSIFGRGVNSMLPLVQQGGEAIREMNQALIDQGKALSPEHVKVMDDFGDAMSRTASTIKNSFIAAMAEAIIAIQRLLGVATMGTQAVAREIADAEKLVAERQEVVSAMERRMAGGMRGGMAESSLKIQKEQLAEAKKGLDELRGAYNKLNSESYGPEAPAAPKTSSGQSGRAAAIRETATATKELTKATSDLGTTFDQVDQQAVVTARIIKDSFGDALEDAMFDFKNFGSSASGILEGLARQIARQGIIDPLSKSVTSSLFGNGLPWDNGLIGSLFAGGFAEGGTLSPGQWGIAGENGPEPIFAGNSPLHVVPNGGGGSSVIVQQTINLSPGLAETVNAAVMNAAPQIAAATQAAIAQDVQNGGAMAQILGRR